MDLQGLTYSVSCDQRTGIKEVYLFKTSEVDSITFDATSREATAITMLTTKQGYKVEIDDDESSVVSTMAGGFGTRTASLLTLSIYKLNASVREIVQSWDRAACLGAIAILYNGERILLGYDFDSSDSNDVYKPVAKLNASGSANSGLVTDAGETATPKILRGYQWTTNYEPPFVDASFDLATFITPA